ncbi:MAG: peptidylprolyl isomerase [Isosphaeraceae bacterium]|nr:peptidylprolyl isomerase [Isosphaeraceae bacterium]
MTLGRRRIDACWGLAALATLCASLMVATATAADDDKNPQVVLDTSMGPITIQLDRAKAPISVDNFLKYVDSGYYNGLVFHRVIDGFMVQGGGFPDYNALAANRERDGLLDPIRNEAGNGLSNQRGTIAMARTNNPNSATSQFYINLVDNSRSLDRNPGSAGYAVFGKVVEGMDVVDKIAKVRTGMVGPHADVPEKPITVRSAKRKK